MRRRKNILLLAHTFADPGGTQKFIYELGRLLAERHNVFECSFDAFNEPHIFQNNNEVLSLGVGAPKSVFGRLTGYLIKAFRLNRIKKRYSIDITISNLWPADFINALSMGRGRKVSNGLVNVVGNHQNRMMLKYQRIVGWIYRRFDKVVAINKDLMAELAKLFELSPTRAACIYAFISLPDINGLEPAYHALRKRIVWFGRLNRMKNLESFFPILVRVKARVPNVQLIVIGEGSHREELVSDARDTGLSVSEDASVSEADVLFLGFVANPYQYMKGCDLFVLTSKSEGFGLVIVEAMSVGLPVLASDCPTGGPHLIMEGARTYQHGRTTAEATPYGYLLPIPEPGSAVAERIWEDAAVELLTDEAKRTATSARCMRRASDFSKDQIRGQWFELLDSI